MRHFFRHALCMVILTVTVVGSVHAAVAASTDQSSLSVPHPVEQWRRYVDAVLESHPDIKAANARVAAAEARADDMDRPLYNPEIVIDGQRGQSDSYSAGIDLTVDVSGKRKARRLSGQKQLQQAMAERDSLRQKLTVEIAAFLVEYYGKQAAYARAQQRLELLTRFAALAEQSYQAGDTGLLDRNLGRLAEAEAIAMSGRAELDQLQARRALDELTRNTELKTPDLPPTPPPPTPPSLNYDELARNLPQVRAATARMDVAMADVDIARSNTKADPTFGIRGGRESSRNEPAKTLIGLQVSIPLLVRNNAHAAEMAANATASVARIESTSLYQQALLRMQATARQYATIYAAWNRWNAVSGKRLDDGIELLEKVWRLREISTSEYLVQLKQLLDGRAAGEELRYQTWRAWVDWLDASGQWGEWRDLPTTSLRNTSSASTFSRN